MKYLPLALRRAGAADLAAFQRAAGLFPSGTADWPTAQALLPYLVGYRIYTVAAGDTYTRIAAQNGTTVRALITANPDQDPARLRIGQRLTVPLGFPVVPTDLPFTYELLTLCLDGLRARYPFLTVNAIGETARGRKLAQIAVGLGPRRVLVNAAHHANEWITVPLVLKFLEEYADAIARGGRIFGYEAQALYQKNVLHLVPMVDPDGVDLVTGGIAPDSAEYRAAAEIAAAFPAIRFPDGWKANLRGVDLNLNYPAGWQEARTIKFSQGFDRPAPRDYVGTGPLSEPESAAMADLTNRLRPARTLSYHSQGEVIYWKYQQIEPPGARELGEDFAAVSGYTLEDVPYASGFAGYKDWFVLKFNRPGYTVEVGRGDNPLPLSQFDEIYQRNLGILTQLLV